jgi:flavin reductase (DIM6/NTAB) family NADH-FMN oxidoreductase RutF/DNA-binding GntR family transcriptional regulator
MTRTRDVSTAARTGAMELDRDVFREVIGHFMSGVTVITATAEGRDYGMTASAVTSLSLEPPMLLACLNNQSPTQQAISRSRVFAVSVLAEDQGDLAKHFARRGDDKFAGVPITRGAGGLPLIGGALAVLECEVSDDVVGGTHRVFLARVRRADARPGAPLAYFRGSFGRVELDLNARALEFVRRSVVTRECALDQPLDVGTLSGALELPPQLVHQALLTLAAEGLVSRSGERELVVTPVDHRSAEQAFRARTAIELGAAELTVGNVSPAQLRDLRDRAWATAALVTGGRLVDVDAYIETDAAFHDYLVGLAESDSLVDAYRRLSIPTLMASLLRGYGRADAVLTREHLALVDAYETGSLDEVRRAIKAHNEHAQAINDAAILSGGGRL